MVKRLWNGHPTQRAAIVLIAVAAAGLLAAMVLFGVNEHKASGKIDAARAEQADAKRELDKLTKSHSGPLYEQYADLATELEKSSQTLRTKQRQRTDMIASGKALSQRGDLLEAEIGSLVTIPDVTGISAYEAETELEARGLKAIYGTKLAAVTFSGSCDQFEQADSTTVLKTAPGVGTRVPSGSTVYLGTYYPQGDSWQKTAKRCAEAERSTRGTSGESSSGGYDGYDGYYDE